MFCANCGSKVEDGSKFCPHCGAKIVVPEAVAEPVAEAVAESAAAAEPVVEAVAEPVAEAVAEPVVEKVAEPVAEAVAGPEVIPVPVVEPAPAVEPVAVEPAVVEPAAVEPAPVVEAAAVEPAPVVGPAPSVEPVSVEPTPYIEPAPYVAEYQPNQANVPQGNVNVQSATNNAAAATPEKPKKKKKVWLIILIIVLAVLLVGGCIIGIIVAIIASVIKNGQQRYNNFISSMQNGYTPAYTSEYNGEPVLSSGIGDPLDVDLSVEDIADATYAGNIEIVDVSGADEMIKYLESVSGSTMDSSEKEAFRNPDISSMMYCEIEVYDDEYSTGGWEIKVPYACGLTSPELRQFSDWDMLTQDQIEDGSYFDSVAIAPVQNSFVLKNQVPDQDNMYAKNLFKKYADYMTNGQFGIQFSGEFRKDRITGNGYGLDGNFVMMFWYDTMSEPYVITYRYEADDVQATVDGFNSLDPNELANSIINGTEEAQELLDQNDFSNFDFDNFNWN